MNVTLFHTKVLVNMYTVVTLPVYALYQRPWARLRAAKQSHVQPLPTGNADELGWIRKGPPPDFKKSPTLTCGSYLEALSMLDRSKPSIGFRDVIEERIDYDMNGEYCFSTT